MATRRGRRGRPLGASEKREVLERLRRGEHPDEVAAAFGCSLRTMQRIYVASLIKSRRIGPADLRLSFAERERISRGVAAGESARAIARALRRAPSTIIRELVANGGRRVTAPCVPTSARSAARRGPSRPSSRARRGCARRSRRAFCGAGRRSRSRPD